MGGHCRGRNEIAHHGLARVKVGTKIIRSAAANALSVLTK
jgi:hypothetical protein